MKPAARSSQPKSASPPVDAPAASSDGTAGPTGPAGAAQSLPAEPPPLTREEMDDLRARANKADENWDRFLRSAADLENYRKRAAREREETLKHANEALLRKLIPVLDNLDAALSAAQTNAPADSLQQLQAGISMVYQQLKQELRDAGLEEIDASGKPFDPHLHEAVSQQETSDVPEGRVVQQLRKGYKLRERLLRPASVVVAAKPTAPPAA